MNEIYLLPPMLLYMTCGIAISILYAFILYILECRSVKKEFNTLLGFKNDIFTLSLLGFMFLLGIFMSLIPIFLKPEPESSFSTETIIGTLGAAVFGIGFGFFTTQFSHLENMKKEVRSSVEKKSLIKKIDTIEQNVILILQHINNNSSALITEPVIQVSDTQLEDIGIKLKEELQSIHPNIEQLPNEKESNTTMDAVKKDE